MTALFYSINASLGLLIVSAVCVLVACGGHVFVHRTFAKTAFNEHNEVAGFVLAIVAVLYAVILGFVTIIVWEHYEQTDQRARAEVDAATDVWRLSRHLPPPSAQRIRDDVARYATSVSVDEWPNMRNGGNPKTQKAIVMLIDDIASFDARGEQQGNVQNHLLDRVQTLADLRRERIYDTGSGVPGVLWVALLVGAATIACFIYLFGMKNFKVQLLLTAATAATIGVAFGLIMELDYPFSGTVSVTPERWVALSGLIAQTR
jgi:Protein of unknown function (DUF4239)